MSLTSLPVPTLTPLRGGPTLRWGVMAPGGIAGAWVSAVHAATDQRVVAVASRSLERAQGFAEQHGIPRSYGSYEQLAEDAEVDIVYIAAPHSEHRRLALLAIAAGKHVLVEKPLGVSEADARVIVDAARAAGVFAMEALWTRFLPQTAVIGELIRDGALGEIRSLTADFGAQFDFDPSNRAFNPDLGGGALLDIGVYTAWFAHFVLGTPERVAATGTLAVTGVDDQASVALSYPAGELATLTMSMRVLTNQIATINGTEARVEFTGPFYAPSSFRVVSASDGSALEWVDDSGLTGGQGLCYQATAVAQHVADGLTESPLHTLDDTLAIHAVLDAARAQLGAR